MKITDKKKLLLYGCSGLGVNMLNLIMGSYLCSALLTGGFVDHIESWTYLNTDLVVAALWGSLILVMKVFDGVIDIPVSAMLERIRSKWGKRRPAILIGFIPMIISYVLFLFPVTPYESYANTWYFGIMLGIFYCTYTITMLTYYATFSEVADSQQDRVFLANTKSVCDVVYFILGFALIPVFVSMDINIRIVALMALPLSLTMIIPFFLLKEKSTKDDVAEYEKPLSLRKSLVVSFKNKPFVFWMFTLAVMNIGTQLFLGGINELFSNTGLNMTVVMASSFVPVPFTILLYNKIIQKRGFGFAYRYILSIFSIGMIIMYFCNINSANMTQLALTLVAMLGGIFVSFAIGAFFSVTYTIPSQLAADEYERTGNSVATMYFAVEGLFEGIASGIATGVILVTLKSINNISLLPLIVCASCLICFMLSLAFPKAISNIGKAND